MAERDDGVLVGEDTPTMNASTGSTIPDLESDQSHQDDDARDDSTWLEWYQETFATELSLFNQSKSPKQPSSSIEVERLRARLRAVDALEDLCSEVECISPVPSRVWEVDAPACHGCRQDLGLIYGKRRHHCRYCGLTFCNDCAPGEVRRCHSCQLKKTRFESVKMIRSFERDALSSTTTTREAILSVARAYRVAMDAFGRKPSDSEHSAQKARGILLEGIHSFLDLDEIKAGLASANSASSSFS